MPEFKRVRLERSGHEVTVAVVGAGMTELKDKKAVDAAGNPLPPKYHTTVDEAAAKKKPTSSGSGSAVEKKES